MWHINPTDQNSTAVSQLKYLNFVRNQLRICFKTEATKRKAIDGDYLCEVLDLIIFMSVRFFFIFISHIEISILLKERIHKKKDVCLLFILLSVPYPWEFDAIHLIQSRTTTHCSCLSQSLPFQFFFFHFFSVRKWVLLISIVSSSSLHITSLSSSIKKRQKIKK